MRDALPLVSVAAGPSCASAPSIPTNRCRPLGATAAASNARFWRTPCVGLVGWNASGTGRSPRNVPSSAYRRTHGAIPRVAMPSDVTMSSPPFASVSPSGSRLNGAYG